VALGADVAAAPPQTKREKRGVVIRCRESISCSWGGVKTCGATGAGRVSRDPPLNRLPAPQEQAGARSGLLQCSAVANRHPCLTLLPAANVSTSRISAPAADPTYSQMPHAIQRCPG
jgi:hypothetical protein